MAEVKDKAKSGEKVRGQSKKKGVADNFWKRLEKSSPAWTAELRRPKWQRWALIVVTALFGAFLIAPNPIPEYSLRLGEPAKETIISPLTFKVIDEEATTKNRDEVLTSILPVYDFDDEMVRDVQERIIQAFNFMRDYLVQEEKYRARVTEGPQPADSATNEEAAGPETFRPLDDKTLRIRFENLLGASVAPSTFAVLKEAKFNSRIERDLRSLVVPVLVKGVVSSRELLMRDGRNGILLHLKSKDKLEPLKDLSKIFDLDEAVHYINVEEKDTTTDAALSKAIRRIARDLINFNITYDRERSEEVKEDALDQFKDVFFQVAKGEVIVRAGDPVNEGHLKKLNGLKKANPPYSRYMIFLGFALSMILLLRLSLYFAEKHLDRSQNATEDLLLFCLLLVGVIILLRFMASLAPLLASAEQGLTSRSLLYAAPVATGAMLMSLMVDPRIAFIFAALSGLTGALAVEGDVYLFFFYFVSGIVGLHGMTMINDRTAVLRAGLVVGVVNMISILALKMALGQLTSVVDLYDVGLGFLGGVLCGLFVSGLAPLLEPLGYTTNVRLLELANLNHPLLQDMAMAAPGTYHHSIMVGNVAEKAAEKINANPLLCLVGGYYHDIGKIGARSKPGYFIENQARGFNPHDKLEPSMSALILLTHVKQGVEKGREYKLGAPIIDIVRQHHGTSLIRFFYNKAKEKTGPNQPPPPEEKYRYPGPKPQTKEAALVMLSDVVEAATRTITDPTPSKIKKRVNELVMSLFSDGQLDDSTMTLKDLHAIINSFTLSLQGILHSRVVYPEENGFQVKKNADTSRQQAAKDKGAVGGAKDPGGKSVGRIRA